MYYGDGIICLDQSGRKTLLKTVLKNQGKRILFLQVPLSLILFMTNTSFPFFILLCALKHGDISLYKDKQHDQRQNIRHIHPCPFRESDSLSAVCLLCKLLPSPSIPAGAEQKINQTSKRKQIVAYQEIFKIQNIFSCAQRRNPTPYIKSENTWNR